MSSTRSLPRSRMLDSLLAHARERLRDRRADRPAANAQALRDLLLGQPEVVVRDDDGPLPLREQREETTHLEPLDDRDGRVVGREVGQLHLTAGAEDAAAGLSQRDPVEPALEIAVARGRVADAFLEGVMQPIKRALAIERRGDQCAVDLGERAVIEL